MVPKDMLAAAQAARDNAHAPYSNFSVGACLRTAEGRLLDAAGKLYAHGTTSCMVGA